MAHLPNKYHGALLIVKIVDGAKKLFTFISAVIAIIEIENRDSWGWFLFELWRYIDVSKSLGIISNHNLGFFLIVKEIFVEVDHRYCMVHFSKETC